MKKISIPAPLIVVVEDVGWWNGFDGSAFNQPFRTGINRWHCPDDYSALITLGKELGIQIIAGFVWCDWDQFNILKNTPTATWMGKKWDNPFKNKLFYEETADIINSNLSNIEMAFHGVGHEFWENGVASRTEFHEDNGNMRSEIDIRKHFNAFEEIYKSSEINAPLPEIFLPPALNHSFGNQAHGFQKILKDFGFNAVITVFEQAKKQTAPLYKNFTKECGVTLIERGASPVKWNEVAAEPVFSFKWPVLSLHWSNLLHFNPTENIHVIKMWADFLNEGSIKNELILLSNAKESIVQLIYSDLAEIEIKDNTVTINIAKAEKVLSDFPEVNLHIKIDINPEETLKIKGGEVVSDKKIGHTANLIKIKPAESKIQLIIH